MASLVSPDAASQLIGAGKPPCGSMQASLHAASFVFPDADAGLLPPQERSSDSEPPATPMASRSARVEGRRFQASNSSDGQLIGGRSNFGPPTAPTSNRLAGRQNSNPSSVRLLRTRRSNWSLRQLRPSADQRRRRRSDSNSRSSARLLLTGECVRDRLTADRRGGPKRGAWQASKAYDQQRSPGVSYRNRAQSNCLAKVRLQASGAQLSSRHLQNSTAIWRAFPRPE